MERNIWLDNKCEEYKEMNRKYLTPKIEIAYIDIESHIATGSAPAKPGDSYSITNDGDKWHQDGGIQNDNGDGPGVTGAKENGFSSSWLD